MPKRTSKRQSDLNVIASQIIRAATDPTNHPAKEKPPKKNPAAVALGRLGGKKGGPARAKKLSAKKRMEIASNAAKVRWAKKT